MLTSQSRALGDVFSLGIDSKDQLKGIRINALPDFTGSNIFIGIFISGSIDNVQSGLVKAGKRVNFNTHDFLSLRKGNHEQEVIHNYRMASTVMEPLAKW